jgi:hypothetical protein
VRTSAGPVSQTTRTCVLTNHFIFLSRRSLFQWLAFVSVTFVNICLFNTKETSLKIQRKNCTVPISTYGLHKEVFHLTIITHYNFLDTLWITISLNIMLCNLFKKSKLRYRSKHRYFSLPYSVHAICHHWSKDRFTLHFIVTMYLQRIISLKSEWINLR